MHCPRRRSPERRAPRGHAPVQAALRSRVRAEAAATAAQVRASVRGGPPASLPSAAQYSACLCASTRGNTPRLARRCADAEHTTCPNRPTRSRPKTGRRESRPIRILLRVVLSTVVLLMKVAKYSWRNRGIGETYEIDRRILFPGVARPRVRSANQNGAAHAHGQTPDSPRDSRATASCGPKIDRTHSQRTIVTCLAFRVRIARR